MFTVLPSRLRLAVLLFAALLGLAAVPAAQADTTDTCFNYLNAQDYARAETEARALLQRPNLARAEQRAAHLCLGRAYHDMGRTRDALPAFQQVEALSQTSGELGTAYNFLGLTYENLGDLDRAELYVQRSLKACRELGDKSHEATNLNNLAGVVKARGEVERALALYQEALSIVPDEAKKPNILNNIAMIYLAREDYVRADQMLRQALDIDRRNGNAHGAARLQLNLGDSLRRQGKLQDAGKELTSGYNAILLVGDKHWEANACESLAKLALAQKKPANGLRWDEWYAKAETLYREIGDTASANKISDLLAGK